MKKMFLVRVISVITLLALFAACAPTVAEEEAEPFEIAVVVKITGIP